MRFNDCFLGKTSLAKSLQMFLGGMGEGLNAVTRPVFCRLKQNNKVIWEIRLHKSLKFVQGKLTLAVIISKTLDRWEFIKQTFSIVINSFLDKLVH